MLEIDATRHSPLDQLVADFYTIRSGQPSIGFCCQVLGVPEADKAVASRLGVAISTVRGWRDVGRKASSRWARQ
jgi:hypothetical protein